MLVAFRRNLVLIVIVVLASFFRLYDLNWGSPYYFHPDERNIASSISQLYFPSQLDPNFFAYGSMPIYFIYFLGVIFNYISKFPNSTPFIFNVDFTVAIILSRITSAFFSILTIILIYKTGVLLKSRIVGMLAAFFSCISIGLVQYAHFGTFETLTSFFSVALLYSMFKYLNRPKLIFYLLICIISGVLISIKISNAPLLVFPVILFLIQTKIAVFKKIIKIFFLFIIISTIYLLGSPFSLIDNHSLLESLKYESSVGTGILPVFYTQSFANTTPIFFQLLKIYPFILNPLLGFLLLPFTIIFAWNSLKIRDTKNLFLLGFLLVLFLSQAFFYAKWTRYIIPTLPFIYLIFSLEILKINKKILTYLFSIFSIIFFISFFITDYIKQDTRISAATFLDQKEKLRDVRIISEPYDLGTLPLRDKFKNLAYIDFYNLEDRNKKAELDNKMLEAKYIFLPSQRIIRSRLTNHNTFPIGNIFYKGLVNGKSNFKLIYQTPCDLFCNITYLGDPVYYYEETASVFDRPTIMIYEKY